MRRMPLTTWYSGMRFLPSVVHCPPAFLTARSRTTGWPLSIAYRARRSAPFWPAHDTTSTPSSMAAVRPCAALYCDRLQLRESADRSEVDADSRRAAATTAAARPPDRIDLFKLIFRLPYTERDRRSRRNV